MMHPPTIRSFSFLYLLVALLTMDLIFSQDAQVDDFTYYFYEANRLYENGRYFQALQFYKKAANENFSYMERTPQIQFKIANCYYQLAKYDSALQIFSEKLENYSILQDYMEWLTLNAYLFKGDTNSVLNHLHEFPERFPNSTLNKQVDSLTAELYFQLGKWDLAEKFYKNYLRYPRVDRGEIYGKLLRIAQYRQHPKTAKKLILKLLKSYIFHPESKYAYKVYRQLTKNRLLTARELKIVFRYLAKTSQFEALDTLLAEQRRLGGDREQLRWLSIRKLYEQKRYWATYKACREQREYFKKTRYWRELDLHIARCYLRLGFVDKSIKAYETFQKRYPDDPLSAEVLWVIAWLSEERGDMAQARRFYFQLINQYPRSEFVEEARFRTGLNEYRQGHFQTAREIWQRFLEDTDKDMMTARLKYWIAKAYEQEKNFSRYFALLKELSDKPFDSYYNLKAFLLTRKSTEIHQFVDSLLWEMHQQQVNLLPKYVKQFRKALLVKDLLGSTYARRELSQLKPIEEETGWEFDFAMGEIHERLENYGRAYRQFRKVYNHYFSDSDWQEWLFMLNRLYPFYFNDIVLDYARQWNITPASIWAIIKKESAFEPRIISYADAYGLMQIIPPTAQRLAKSLGMELEDVRELFNPSFNIFLGSYYLSELIKRYEGNLYYALAAYNAGEHRVDRWRKVINTQDDDFFMENIEFEQTRKYVRTAMKYYWTYHLLIHPQSVPEYIIPFPEKVAREPWFDGVKLR
ncbi:MAG: hypothetical protein D6748_13955 [Calditrichaeota bacterium]|nr:MAG: hypothetical protein D6748_13955 [Calditrichota bacterium]